MFKELLKLPVKKWIAMIFFLLFLLPSGLFFLFIYKRDLFNNLEFIKLIIITIAITIPLTIPVIFIGLRESYLNELKDQSNKKEEVDRFIYGVYMGTAVIGSIFYIISLVGYFFVISLSYVILTLLPGILLFFVAKLFLINWQINKIKKSKK
ncbi:MAG: hypothetical protein Q8941_08555 [Bacteroidota bacterium]|nr:hypothetical protein [Bacteroidota bacterium]